MRFMLICLFTALAFLAPAHAATFEGETRIWLDHTTPSYDVEVEFGMGLSHRVPQMTIPSTWSYLDCVASANGSVDIRFRSTPANWPSTWPSSATCEVDHGGNTYRLLVNISDCDGAAWCENGKEGESDGTVPTCSMTNSRTLVQGQSVATACFLDAAPSGKAYTLPGNITGNFGNHPTWNARWRVGSTPSTSDPLVEGMECQVVPWKFPLTTKYYLRYIVSARVPSSSKPYYCPIRLVNTSTGGLSWGDPFYLMLSREN